jgi:hypothetical protein
LNAFFKELDRIFERQIALLELIHDSFQLLERLFKLGHGSLCSQAGIGDRSSLQCKPIAPTA